MNTPPPHEHSTTWIRETFNAMTATQAKRKGYTPVVHAADMEECECCGEAYCAKHKMHYHECPCIGPTEDGVDFIEIAGNLWGKRV